MFKKKFKVRIRHFSEKYYTVEYCHYRIFRNWKSLHYFFCISVSSDTDEWTTALFTFKEAEELATKLNSIEDIDAYYQPERLKAAEWNEKKKSWYNNNVPYKIKIIR